MAFCEAANSDEPGLKGLEHWTIGAIQSGVQALAATAKDPHHLAANPLGGLRQRFVFACARVCGMARRNLHETPVDVMPVESAPIHG